MLRKYKKKIVLVVLVILLAFFVTILVLGSIVPIHWVRGELSRRGLPFDPEKENFSFLRNFERWETGALGEVNFINKFFYITQKEGIFLGNLKGTYQELLANPRNLDPNVYPEAALELMDPEKFKKNALIAVDLIFAQKNTLKTLFFVFVPTINLLLIISIAFLVLPKKIKNKITKRQNLTVLNH